MTFRRYKALQRRASLLALRRATVVLRAAQPAAAKELPAMFAWMSDVDSVPAHGGDSLRWTLTPLGRAELDDASPPDVDQPDVPGDESH